MSAKTVAKRLRATRFHAVEVFGGSAAVKLHNKIIVAAGIPWDLASAMQDRLNQVLDESAELIERQSAEVRG